MTLRFSARSKPAVREGSGWKRTSQLGGGDAEPLELNEATPALRTWVPAGMSLISSVTIRGSTCFPGRLAAGTGFAAVNDAGAALAAHSAVLTRHPGAAAGGGATGLLRPPAPAPPRWPSGARHVSRRRPGRTRPKKAPLAPSTA